MPLSETKANFYRDGSKETGIARNTLRIVLLTPELACAVQISVRTLKTKQSAKHKTAARDRFRPQKTTMQNFAAELAKINNAAQRKPNLIAKGCA